MLPRYHIEHRISEVPTTSRRCYGGWLCLLILGLLVGGVGCAFYFKLLDKEPLQRWVHYYLSKPQLEQQLINNNVQLQQQTTVLEQLNAELIAIKRDHSIQNNANLALQGELNLMSQNLERAQQKVLMYEKLFATEPASTGLHIRVLSLAPVIIDERGQRLNDTQRYYYHLIITNPQNDNAFVVANWHLSVTGLQNDKTITLAVDQLTPHPQMLQSEIQLKYYQSIEGELVLPSAFKPQMISVSVQIGNGKTISSVYNWDTFKTRVNPVTN